MVPPDLRDAVLVNYRPGEEMDKNPSQEYIGAAVAAIEAVAAKGIVEGLIAMSWTTIRGHRPIGPVVHERPLGDHDAPLDHISQMCSCGEALYAAAHISIITDRLNDDD
jgi:hypothetical protein